jgi:hypothetical protein
LVAISPCFGDQSELFWEVKVRIGDLIDFGGLQTIETCFAVVVADIENLVSHYFQFLGLFGLFITSDFFGGPGGFVFNFVAFLSLVRLAEYSFPVLKIRIALLDFVTEEFEA